MAADQSNPVAFPLLLKTKYDWDFATEPEQGLNERRIYLHFSRSARTFPLGHADAPRPPQPCGLA